VRGIRDVGEENADAEYERVKGEAAEKATKEVNLQKDRFRGIPLGQ
jgi:hypothetical protein